MVAIPAAASSDPAARYPAVKPPRAAIVPDASASPNRARHARHRPALAAAVRRSAACRPGTAPPGTPLAGNAGTGPVLLVADGAAMTPRMLMLSPRAGSFPSTARGSAPL